ncbi:MAG: 23S rRNA (adenine(2503)-C(2))-methyltransferase RlmN [Desulfovibrionaceae bacterium]|nr:23S rRNA (adenine(2503)-C(2))-methyltransferase RlmN [Desulfovibrionaceae bacterium]
MNLLNLTFSELEALVRDELGQPGFRAAQLWQWMWQKGCRDFAEMTNLSKDLRAGLAQRAGIVWPETVRTLVSRDNTVKFLLRLFGGALIESVLIPGPGRFTQCLSTQAGCAMACTFCNTGRMGLERNLNLAEILGQVLVGRRYLEDHGLDPLKNLVFMGMGEPLQNLDEVLRALSALGHPLGLGFSPRRTTVSTVGLPEGLEALGRSGLALPAVSLHAPNQELRARIMPRAARVPLSELMACLDRYPLRPRERITYEYLLLKGVNDSLDHARQLAGLLSGRRCKVNLIAFNPCPGIPYQAPDQEAVLAFERLLWDKGLTATLRRGMGLDIQAACGQLRAEAASVDSGP